MKVYVCEGVCGREEGVRALTRMCMCVCVCV